MAVSIPRQSEPINVAVSAHDIRVALAAARRMRRPMPLLMDALRAAGQRYSVVEVVDEICKPDLRTTLADLLQPVDEERPNLARRRASGLKAIDSLPSSHTRGEAGQRRPSHGAANRQALRLVRDPAPSPEHNAATSTRHEGIAADRARLRRLLLGGSVSAEKRAVAPEQHSLPKPSARSASLEGDRDQLGWADCALGSTSRSACAKYPDNGCHDFRAFAEARVAAHESQPLVSAKERGEIAPELLVGRERGLALDGKCDPEAAIACGVRLQPSALSANASGDRTAIAVGDPPALAPVSRNRASLDVPGPAAVRPQPLVLYDDAEALIEAAWRNGAGPT